MIRDTTYYRSGGESDEISSNIFEFFATLAGLAIVARTKSHMHMLIHSDNTSSLAWAQKCRGDSSLHTFLLRVLCDVQITTHHVMAGHVSGADNVHADAISWQFAVPNGDAIRTQVDREATAPRVRMIDQLWGTFSSMLRLPSPTPSETDHGVRAALEFVTGTNSALRI